MRKLLLITLVLPFLSVPAAAADPPPEVLAWTTTAGAWVSVGGEPGKLVVPGAQDVAVSLDGTKLATVRVVNIGHGRGRGRLFVSGIDGSSAVNVTPGDDPQHSSVRNPAFSPDGTRLAYDWYPESAQYYVGSQLRTVSVEGGTPTHVDVYDGFASEPSWSPDGAFLAVNRNAIGLVSVAGRQAAQLPQHGVGHYSNNPAWSPNGTKVLSSDVAYTAYPQPPDSVYAGSVARLTDSELLTDGQSTAWAADGTRFYARTSDGAVHRFLADGTLDGAFTPIPAADHPSAGGGTPPAHDSAAPGPVTAVTSAAEPSLVQIKGTAPADNDFAGVLVRYAKGAVAPATLTDGTSLGRAPSAGFLARHLLPDTQYSFSVWTVDWSGNRTGPVSTTATTPHQIATTMRMGTPRLNIDYGDVFTVSARIIREDTGGGLAGARVTLLGTNDKVSNQVLATSTTDASGLVRFVRRPLRAVEYTVRYDGTGQLQAQSGSMSTSVNQKAIAVASPHIVKLGSRAVYNFTMRPAAIGRHLTVRQLIGTKEIARRTFTLDRYGHARVVLDTTVHGNEVLETFLPEYDGRAPVRSRIGFGVA